MSKKAEKPTKQGTKTLREEDVITRPRPKAVGTTVRTGVRAGQYNAAKNANNGEGGHQV
jgi:hypothetical protein